MDFQTVADDFFVNLNVQTTLALPTGRETVLHFCEAVQRQFPLMSSFYRRESGEYVLEGDQESGCYPWMELQRHNLAAGWFSPETLQDVEQLHKWLLERCPAFLSVSRMDIECLDVLFGFNLDCRTNRDAVTWQALLAGSPLDVLNLDAAYRPLECQPGLVFALDEECYLQGRVAVETHSSSYQVRTGRYEEEPISVYLTIRHYPRPGRTFDPQASYDEQFRLCEDLCRDFVVPQVVQPIASAIATAQ